MVLDDDGFIIGTYNLDPRSANINKEMALLCIGNKELTKAVSDNIADRRKGSTQLTLNTDNEVMAGDKPYKDSPLHSGDSLKDSIKYFLTPAYLIESKL